jgi:hypothetical protein
MRKGIAENYLPLSHNRSMIERVEKGRVRREVESQQEGPALLAPICQGCARSVPPRRDTPPYLYLPCR